MGNNFFSKLVNLVSPSSTNKVEETIIYNYTEDDFLRVLKPYNIFQKKKRLGPNEDGGYVCSEFVLDNCSSLMTYGVGHDIRYEEEFFRLYNKPTYLFDHTLGWKEEFEHNGLKFIPEGLGSAENCEDFYVHYERYGIKENVLLKIDVEGAEWEFFKNVDVTKLKNVVMGIIVEIHWIDSIDNRKNLAELFNRIEPYFVLEHTHANSWGYNFEHNGMSIPSVLELSFVNKKFVDKMEIDTADYPIDGIDYSNNPNIEDVNLGFLKSV
jgi:hypothetical protein